MSYPIERYVMRFTGGPHAGRYVKVFREPEEGEEPLAGLVTTDDYREALWLGGPHRPEEADGQPMPPEVRALWGVEIRGTRPLTQWPVRWELKSFIREDCPDCGAPVRWAADEGGHIAAYEPAEDGVYAIEERDGPRWHAVPGEGFQSHGCA